ncbi:MAG: tetratricopeptide repeat protein [Cyanobacteria bacterium P01_A01_bin.84]
MVTRIALLYSDEGKYEQAEPLYKQAVEIVERVLGANHPDTVLYQNNLKVLRTQQQTSGDDSLLGSLKRWFLG